MNFIVRLLEVVGLLVIIVFFVRYVVIATRPTKKQEPKPPTNPEA